MRASYFKYRLNFKEASKTSRGTLIYRETWFIKLEKNSRFGIGECGMFRGLSFDDRPDFERKLSWVCDNINLDPNSLFELLDDFPSIKIGLEIAYLALGSFTPFVLHPSKFTSGQAAIPINGLIWMGDKRYMKEQIKSKLNDGFECIKIKIGAIDFESEVDLIKEIRAEYSAKVIEIRVDANGAFSNESVLEKLKILSDHDIHSIEQPISKGQYDQMAELCNQSPIPIALDEELIGIKNNTKKLKILDTIKPHYIILKPTLLGGFKASEYWIQIANERSIGWWVTSALESNIGLNAIAQWTFGLKFKYPQGLGTGSLFTNNIESPLKVNGGELYYQPSKEWKINF